MLGDILQGLTDATMAENLMAAIGRPDIIARVELEAAAEGVAAGALAAAKLRHLLDHAGEDVWLDLLGLMSRSPEPGIAALQAMLSRAFPDPIGRRVSESQGRVAPLADPA